MKITLDKNFYLRKYESYEVETLPEHIALKDISRKNVNYTLRNIFLFNELFRN